MSVRADPLWVVRAGEPVAEAANNLAVAVLEDIEMELIAADAGLVLAAPAREEGNAVPGVAEAQAENAPSPAPLPPADPVVNRPAHVRTNDLEVLEDLKVSLSFARQPAQVRGSLQARSLWIQGLLGAGGMRYLGRKRGRSSLAPGEACVVVVTWCGAHHTHRCSSAVPTLPRRTAIRHRSAICSGTLCRVSGSGAPPATWWSTPPIRCRLRSL